MHPKKLKKMQRKRCYNKELKEYSPIYGKSITYLKVGTKKYLSILILICLIMNIKSGCIISCRSTWKWRNELLHYIRVPISINYNFPNHNGQLLIYQETL